MRWTLALVAMAALSACGKAPASVPADLKPLQPITTLTTTTASDGKAEVAQNEADQRAADGTRQRDGLGGMPR